MLIDYALDKHASILNLIVQLHVRVEYFPGPRRVLLVYDPYNVKTLLGLFGRIPLVVLIRHGPFATAEIGSVVSTCLGLPNTLLKSILIEILHGTT